MSSFNKDMLVDIEDLTNSELIHKVHNEACKKNYNTYIDHETGYKVFTEFYLKQRKCCGNKCRHCPWNHINVKNSN